jgi:hypothetical protein
MFIANCSKKSEQAAFSSHLVVCGARLASLPSMSLPLREQKSGFDSTSRLRLHCGIAKFLTARSLLSHLSLIPCYAYLPNASQRITKDRDQVNTIFSASSKPCRIAHDRSVLDIPQTQTFRQRETSAPPASALRLHSSAVSAARPPQGTPSLDTRETRDYLESPRYPTQ